MADKDFYKYLRDCLKGSIDPMRVVEDYYFARKREESGTDEELAAVASEDVLYHAEYNPETEGYLEGQGTMSNFQR